MPLRILFVVVLLLFPRQLAADSSTAREEFVRGTEARERGDYAAAIDAFSKALRDDARTEYELALAEVLGWSKRFEEAAALYANVLQRDPHSRAARLGLAQQRLWQQRYTEAAGEYSALLRDRPDDVDARTGLATARYWNGDLRAARRDFEAVLAARPGDTNARAALADIRIASAPRYRVESAFASDDQPLRRSQVRATYEHFLDPSTSLAVSAGTIHLDAGDPAATATAPFAAIDASSAWPSRRLRAAGSLRLMRFPDGETQPLGSVALFRSMGRSTLELSVDRSDVLYTATSLDDHPTVTTSTLRWSRDHDGTLSAIGARASSYFDGNSGVAADAYHLVRVLHRTRVSASVGASVAYRDSSESRFVLRSASSARALDGTWVYRYQARYDPYWTPERLVEARVVVASTHRHGRLTLDLHADGGIARDRDLLFGPSSGPSGSVPLYATPVETARTFHPWKASATVSWPLSPRHALEAGFEHHSTAFYNANIFQMGVTGRFR